jgi:hypothetical protein
VGNIEENVFFLGIEEPAIMLAAKGDSIDSISFWVGLPISYNIFSI